MYDTPIVAGLRFLRLPLTQYSPVPVLAASLIATFGFCAHSGRAKASNIKNAPNGRETDFMSLAPLKVVESAGPRTWPNLAGIVYYFSCGRARKAELADHAGDRTRGAGVE